LHSLYLSFTNYTLAGSQSPAFELGLQNYNNALFHDAAFRHSVLLTFIFAFTALTGELLLGFVIALWLASNRQFAAKILPVLIIPSLIPPVVVGLMWSFLFQSRFGPIVQIAKEVGFANAQSPFSLRALALPAVIAVDVWQWTPFVALLLFAGIVAVPRPFVESAMVDGASGLQVALTIVIPQIRPTLFAVGLVRFIDLIREFDKVFVLTGGGPSDSTELVSLLVWRVGFKYWEISSAAALSIIVYVLIAAVAYVSFTLVGRRARA
jgi:multiple sugar transport system permease protein